MEVDDNIPSTSSANVAPPTKKFFPIQSGERSKRDYYLRYRPNVFSHMANRMLPQDCVARQIYNAGPKGIDRIRIAEIMALNAEEKSGSRKVSDHIQMLSRGLPDETGVYQKMNGKFRVHNFYHKSFKPDAYADLSKPISDLIGRECPIKIGQCIDFPDSKLTRMRVTDVCLKRMLIMLKEVREHSVVLIRNITDAIINAEKQEGSAFMIDRRSIQKLYTALKYYGLVQIHTVKVVEDDTENECELKLVCSPDVASPTDQRIRQKIIDTRKEYQEQSKIFPSGQKTTRATRYPKKPPVISTPTLVAQDEPEIDPIETTTGTGSDGTKVNYSQRKLIRLHILHQYLYRFIYHPQKGQDVPSFNVERAAEEYASEFGTPEDDMHVYDDTVDSFFRYVPPISPPPHPTSSETKCPQGWFVVRDAIRAMPLSVFALVMDIELDAAFDVYLNDPIKRNILLYDLPISLRKQVFTRKATLNMDFQCFQLCCLGLMLSGPEDFTASGRLSLYYLRPNAIIYDTSTSAKGYALINDPVEKFTRYNYNFKSLKDIHNFWYHLRAVALSTPLNVKNLRKEEREKETVDAKKFSKDSFNKKPYMPPNVDSVTWKSNLLPGKGAALMEAGIYIHLKRQWDMISVNNTYAEWYMKCYKKDGEACRKFVEVRVAKLNKYWFSVMSSMVTSGNELLFKKRCSATIKRPAEDADMEETEAKRPKVGTLKLTAGKRRLDAEDIDSINKYQQLRYRFTNRERDMMVLMRAISQFLNPASKLWIDPAVIRRIMKSYLEESSTKTMLCLLTASCREASIPHRQKDIWHLVRGLGSFTQMRRIRDQLAVVLKEDFEAKADYFCQAFDIAYRLVTNDIPRLPSPKLKDSTFYSILIQNHLTVGETMPSPSDALVVLPPVNENEIKDSLMYSWILNVLLNESNNVNNTVIPSSIAQRGNESFYNTLETMLADGVACRTRSDIVSSVKFKNHIAVSVAFCLYFSHSYRPDLWKIIESLPSEFPENVGTYTDSIAAFLRVAYCMTDENAHFDISIGLDAFPSSDAWETMNSRRQLRDTETGALKLNAIEPFIESELIAEPKTQHVESSYESQAMLDVDKIDVYGSDKNLKEFCKNFNEMEVKAIVKIIESLKKATFHGRTISEIMTICYENSVSDEDASSLLKQMENNFIIFLCGIDTRRYVHVQYVLDWGLCIDGKALFIKPWTNADGTIDYPTFRWMSEMVFATINESPCVPLDYIKNYFSSVIQPVFVDDILDFLLKVKVIESFVEEISSIVIRGPFNKAETVELQTSYRAVYNGIELFALVFKGIEIPEFIRQKQQQQQREQARREQNDEEEEDLEREFENDFNQEEEDTSIY